MVPVTLRAWLRLRLAFIIARWVTWPLDHSPPAPARFGARSPRPPLCRRGRVDGSVPALLIVVVVVAARRPPPLLRGSSSTSFILPSHCLGTPPLGITLCSSRLSIRSALLAPLPSFSTTSTPHTPRDLPLPSRNHACPFPDATTKYTTTLRHQFRWCRPRVSSGVAVPYLQRVTIVRLRLITESPYVYSACSIRTL